MERLECDHINRPITFTSDYIKHFTSNQKPFFLKKFEQKLKNGLEKLYIEMNKMNNLESWEEDKKTMKILQKIGPKILP